LIPKRTFRHRLLTWYRGSARDLPWRRTSDPYAIWVSEIMLQQTRVQAVIPYYERFLARFPDVRKLAAASESDLLAAWAGLGYYSRARNLHRAAREIVAAGEFPRTYDALLELPGIGDYTAAAIASIAFGAPRAALDGNVARVLARLSAEPGNIKAPAIRRRLQELAGELLNPNQPGMFNQAMMELGATICTPKSPACAACPVAALCEARSAGRQSEIPVLGNRAERRRVYVTVFVVEHRGSVLLRRRDDSERRMAGFWDLPEQLNGAETRKLGTFRHSIVNNDYEFEVRIASLTGTPPDHRWWPLTQLHSIPLSTTAKKAIACWRSSDQTFG
jgi:A/G-specific adenine glycosylase